MATQLDIIIKQDQVTYRNLVKIKTVIADGRKKIGDYIKGDRTYFNNPATTPARLTALYAVLTKLESDYYRISKNYNDRQWDLKHNTQYGLSDYLTEAKDNVTRFFSNLFNSTSNNVSGVNGLGFIFLLPLVPLIWAGAAVIATATIAYFAEKHYSKSVVDYNESERSAIEALRAGDPELANKILNNSNDVQVKQTEENGKGFFSELGTGAKWALAVGGSALIIAGGIKVAKDQGWIESKSKVNQK